MIITLKNVSSEKALELQKLLADDEFANKVFAADSLESAKTMFAAKGLDLNNEELEEIANAFNNAADATENELAEEQLEGVAGGIMGVNIYYNKKKQILNVTIIW